MRTTQLSAANTNGPMGPTGNGGGRVFRKEASNSTIPMSKSRSMNVLRFTVSPKEVLTLRLGGWATARVLYPSKTYVARKSHKSGFLAVDISDNVVIHVSKKRLNILLEEKTVTRPFLSDRIENRF